MGLIKLIQVLAVAYGIYLIMTEVLKAPAKKTSRAVMEYLSKENSRKTLDMYLLDIAVKLSRHIRLLPYQKERLHEQLTAAGFGMTPETYTAFAYVKAAFYIILGMLFLVIPKFGFLFCVLLCFAGVNFYFVESTRAEVFLQKRKTDVEKELPRLANTIRQELRRTRDVVKILEDYSQNASKSMQAELAITVADMKSGNYEMALKRLETRISSVTLSQIVRGLNSVLRGDDGFFYFEMLSHDLRKMEQQQLRMEAVKQPEKIGKYSAYMFICLLAIVGTVMGIVMLSQFKTVF